MSTPDQPRYDDDRPTGGVRGAINDLLGRGDRTDDDRRTEDQHLSQERSDAGHDAGTRAPDAWPADDAYGTPGTPGRPADATVGAAAPQGAPFDGRTDGAVAGGARHVDVGPGGPGYEASTLSSDSPVRAVPTQDGPDPTRYDDSDRTDDRAPGVDAPTGATAGGPAGARTVDPDGYTRTDVNGSDTEYATTTPVTPAHNATADRVGDHAGDHADTTDRTGGVGPATTPATSGTEGVADTAKGEDAQGRERLVSKERAASYGSRWDTVKGEFVDEPRKAVADADALVGELLDELQTLFSDQRRGIEHSLDADETSTEDMRLALRRYRSFFDRLLSI